jgi:perosamine synthetase
MDATRAPVLAFKPGLTAADARAVAQAVGSGWAGGGVYVRLFERRLAAAVGVPHALAVSSGTAALHLALRVLDVEGGEVITTPLTSPATSHAILYNRARPVFGEVEDGTGNLDARRAAELVTSRTRAIVAVHFNGQPCDMDALRRLAREKGLALVEDAGGALPVGGLYRGKPLGSLGDLACFSFSRKNFTTLDGGAVVHRAGRFAARLRRLRNLGQDEGPAAGERAREISELGFPYRMNDLTAAVGLSQFDRWDASAARLAGLERLYRAAVAGLSGLEPPVERDGARRALSCFPVRVRGRGRKNALRAFLAARGVRTDDWLRPNHLFPLYESRGLRLPIAERLASELLYLPFYPGLTGAEAGRVVEALSAFRS